MLGSFWTLLSLSLTPHVPSTRKQCRCRASSAAVLILPGWNPLTSLHHRSSEGQQPPRRSLCPPPTPSLSATQTE